MWQLYSKVPAVVNVRDCDMFAFAPAMASGAPAGELSKKTLWATSPKVKVTVPPTPIATFEGVNVSSEVAFTAAVMGGGPAGLLLLDDPGEVDELHAAASTAAALVRVRMMRMIRRDEGRASGGPLTFADGATRCFHSSGARTSGASLAGNVR
jgi:hypothetical protein